MVVVELTAVVVGVIVFEVLILIGCEGISDGNYFVGRDYRLTVI